MKVIIFFDRFGPYHIARLEGASSSLSVVGLELCGESVKYGWDKVDCENSFERITLFPDKSFHEISGKDLIKAFASTLDTQQPDAIAIPGWSYKGALAALYASRRAGIPAVVMSESTAIDDQRHPMKELIKRKLISQFSAGLVGGSRHKGYLIDLGMESQNIFTGYNAVDNRYFTEKSDEARVAGSPLRESLGLPKQYFLASSRFIRKKNIPLLLEAYSDYFHQAGKNAWKLVLLGDGPLQEEIFAERQRLDLEQQVFMPGFRQYQDLPAYFAFSGAFVHASTNEQWGLVINEALACGLPVIVSERCGCAPELVQEGRNGFTFDPHNKSALTALLLRISGSSFDRDSAAVASREIVESCSTDAFREGIEGAINTAISHKPRKWKLADAALLRALIAR